MAILGSSLFNLPQNPTQMQHKEQPSVTQPCPSLSPVSHLALPSLTFSYTSLLSAPSKANLALGPVVPSSWSILPPEVTQLAHSWELRFSSSLITIEITLLTYIFPVNKYTLRIESLPVLLHVLVTVTTYYLLKEWTLNVSGFPITCLHNPFWFYNP